MPTRIIREGILTSERIAKLGWAEEVFYRRLMSVVDDYGRFHALAPLLRAACYPLQLEKVSDSDIEKWLRCAEKAALVRVYSAQDGKRYLTILDFGQRLQSKSKFPAPPNEAPESTVVHRESPETTAIDGVEVGGECERGDEGGGERPPPKRTRPNKIPLPSDFAISDRVKAWAAAKGFADLNEHLESFRRKCSANGYLYANWDDAFMEAIREDWAKIRRGGNGHGPAPRESLFDGPSPAAQRRL